MMNEPIGILPTTKLRRAEDRIKELEQQLLEQAAYGVYLRTKIQGGKTIDANPSQDLINQMKAEAIREFISHIKGMSDEDQKLKGRFQAELFWKGAFAVHEFGIDYAKQLEQTNV